MAMAASPNVHNTHSAISMNVDTLNVDMSEKTCVKEESPTPQLEQDNNSSKNSFKSYFPITIRDPANTLVKHRIQKDTAKMLVISPAEEQRLITFDIPNEYCTIDDLLDQIKIKFSGGAIITSVNDSKFDINYIVEVGYKAYDPSHNTDDHVDCNSTSQVVKSTMDSESSLESIDVLGKSSNSSLQLNEMVHIKNNKRNATKLEEIEQDDSSCKRLRGKDESTTFKPKVINKELECLTVSSDEEDKFKKIGTNSSLVLGNACNSLEKNIDTALEQKPIITDTAIFNSSCNDVMNSEECHSRKVLEEAEIPSVKMPQLLCHMRNLGQNKISESMLQCFQHLLVQTQANLTGPKQSLDEPAAFADLLNNVSTSNNVASISSNSQNIQQQLSTIVDRLECLLARQSTWHPSQHRTRSRSPVQKKRLYDNDELCWYHATFGNNAKKCVTPCSWNYCFNQGN